VSAAMPQAKKEPEEDVETATRNVLNPLDVMVITRERLQDTLDDAVRRGRMTRDDAADLLAEIVRRAISAPTDRVKREVRRVTGATDGFPIDEYDELTAAQIVAALAALTPDDLRRVRDYERRNANRKTVLSALDAKLA
jgi:polyhydroxyalkanoate synthesis regulator phasin